MTNIINASANATEECYLNGLNNHDVQSTYVDNDNKVYSICQHTDEDGLTDSDYLYIGTLSGHQVSYYRRIILNHFGHCRTIGTFTDNYNGNDYLLITTHDRYDPKSKVYWSTQLARIPKNPSTNYILHNDSSVNRLVYLNWASGKNFGTIKRIDASICSRNNHIIVATWNLSDDDKENVQFSLIDGNKLNYYWDNNGNVISVKDNYDIFIDSSFSICGNDLPRESLQGIAIDNNDNVYIVGGRSYWTKKSRKNKNQSGHRPQILIFNYYSHLNNGKLYLVRYKNWDSILKAVEPEGIHINNIGKRKNVAYFGVYYQNSKQNRLYTIPLKELKL